MPGSSFTILIVEDDFSLRKSLVLSLKRFNFRTLEASNGKEALAFFSKETIDGVLLDAIMPIMDGFETCREIRQIQGCEHIPILLITGLNDLESIDRAYSAGATDFILKPVHLHVLSHRILRLVQAVRLESQLTQKQVEFDGVFEAIPDPILLTGPDRTILASNRAFEAQFGYEESELRGEYTQLLYADPDDFEKEDEFLFDFHAARKHRGTPEFQYRRKDGSSFEGETLGSVMRDRSGSPVGYIHIIRDITQRKKVEEERQKADKLATMGLLAGGIAHDFNNIITALSTSIALARAEMPPGGKASHYLTECEPAMKHAVDLSKQLLTFAKGGAPVKRPSRIDRLCREAVEFALRATRSVATFAFEDDIHWSEIDPGQFVQVISNLVINADQAMPDGGTVEVALRNLSLTKENPYELPAGPAVELSIGDHGCGIPDEVVERIFDPYFTTKDAGSGLGLTTAYSIIKKHGGYLGVASQAGQGTRFTIVLPASSARNFQEIDPVPAEANLSCPENARILLLEDQEIIRRGVSKLLEREGFRVVCASGGEDAIEMFNAAVREGDPFQLLILDLTLPGGINGAETLRRIRTKDDRVPAIASSGYAEDPVMSSPEDFHFTAVLPKPFSREDLLRVVTQTLRQRIEVEKTAEVTLPPSRSGAVAV